MRNQSVQNKNFAAVDLTKFMMSILIVALHTYVFRSVSSILNGLMTACITRIAVPIFFIYTGFFLGAERIKITLQIEKMIKLYLILSLFFVPWRFIIGGVEGNPVPIEMLIKDFALGNSYQHLWYCYAVIISGFLIYLYAEHRAVKVKYGMCIFAVIVYVFGLLGSGYYGINMYFFGPQILEYIDKYFYFNITRHVTFAFPFMFFGYEWGKSGQYVRKKASIALLAVSLILWLFEIYVVQKYSLAKDYSMTIMLFPCAAIIACISLGEKLPGNPELYKRMRFYSQWIFYTHLIGRDFLQLIFKGQVNSVLLFLGSLLLAFVFGRIAELVQSKSHKLTVDS